MLAEPTRGQKHLPRPKLQARNSAVSTSVPGNSSEVKGRLMLKRDELSNPQSCMSRARDDEMTFVLLERDPATAITIRFWVMERLRIGKNSIDDSTIWNALRIAEEIDKSKIKTPRDHDDFSAF